MGGTAGFEIEVRREGRWMIERIVEAEDQAVADLKRLAQDPSSEAVRIAHVTEHPNTGAEMRSIIKTLDLTTRAGVIAAAPVETAPLCASGDDLWSLQSRQAINQVLRPWLDHHHCTVIELLCLPSLMAKLEREDGLLSGAVSRIAAVQIRLHGGDPKDRAAALSRLITATRNRATGIRLEGLPSLDRATGLAPLGQAIARHAAPEDQVFALTTLIAKELGQHRTLDSKLTWLLEGASQEPARQYLAVYDHLIGDILNNASLVAQLLGPREDLRDALEALVSLALGEFDPKSMTIPEGEDGVLLTSLAEITATGMTSEIQSVLIHRVAGMLRSPQPFVRHGKGWGAFHRLITRTYGGMIDGPTPLLAQGFVDQAARIANAGGEAGIRGGLKRIAARMEHDWDLARFLIHFSQAPMGAGHQAQILEEAHDLLPMLGRPDLLARRFSGERSTTKAEQVLRREISNCPLFREHLIDRTGADG